MVEYLDVEQEAPAIIEKSRPPAYWPSSTGGLEIENLTVHYAPHLPPALQSVSFSIRPSEKIGVVGRTGSGMTGLCCEAHNANCVAGKSTLAYSLLRMIEPTSGRIM